MACAALLLSGAAAQAILLSTSKRQSRHIPATKVLIDAVAMLPARPAILLDLDGTLVDPAKGIVGCFQRTLADLNASVPPFEQLQWIIGPSLRESFASVLGSGADIEKAVSIYRMFYGAWGLTRAHLYEGIPELLAAHAAKGTKLYICTAKHHGFARRVADYFNLSQFLDGVYGPELDGLREDKGDLIAWLLGQEGLSPADACMIGDRAQDVLAARRHGIPAIGVLWGYGSRSELEEAGASCLVEHPQDLLPQ